jgi:hypothetical protein
MFGAVGITCQVSVFVIYLLGNLTDWRTVAGISAAMPVITALYALMVSTSCDITNTFREHSTLERREVSACLQHL